MALDSGVDTVKPVGSADDPGELSVGCSPGLSDCAHAIPERADERLQCDALGGLNAMFDSSVPRSRDGIGAAHILVAVGGRCRWEDLST